jgi:hypothetical protein
MKEIRDPSGLRVIEALAPQHTRFKIATGDDYFSDLKRKQVQFSIALKYAEDPVQLWGDIFGERSDESDAKALPNVCLGVSVEDQLWGDIFGERSDEADAKAIDSIAKEKGE